MTPEEKIGIIKEEGQNRQRLVPFGLLFEVIALVAKMSGYFFFVQIL